MRQDQIERLQRLGEQVMDAFLDAADPAVWAGAGKEPAGMDPATRGARNWDAKNANQMGSLVARILDLRARLKEGGAPNEEKPDDEAEHDIAKYEKQARDMVKKVQEKAK